MAITMYIKYDTAIWMESVVEYDPLTNATLLNNVCDSCHKHKVNKCS